MEKMNKVLVIVDMQNDYFEGGSMELVGAAEAGQNAARVLEHFRQQGLPVVHIQHVAASPQAGFFLPDTEGVNINKCVEPGPGEEVFIKHYPNSFRETGLDQYLQEKGVTDLTIVGMMTHMCIDATTRAAKDLGYNCTLVGDACATRDLEIAGQGVKASEVQKAFLAALNYFYSTVVTTDEYLKS